MYLLILNGSTKLFYNVFLFIKNNIANFLFFIQFHLVLFRRLTILSGVHVGQN